MCFFLCGDFFFKVIECECIVVLCFVFVFRVLCGVIFVIGDWKCIYVCVMLWLFFF